MIPSIKHNLRVTNKYSLIPVTRGVFRSENSLPLLTTLPTQIFLHSQVPSLSHVSSHNIGSRWGTDLIQIRARSQASAKLPKRGSRVEAGFLLLCQLWEERQDLTGHKVCSYRVGLATLFLPNSSLYGIYIFIYIFIYIYRFRGAILNTNPFHGLVGTQAHNQLCWYNCDMEAGTAGNTQSQDSLWCPSSAHLWSQSVQWRL